MWFPNWLQAYLDYACPNSEAPEAFHYWTGISTIAGALRRRCWISMENFRWYPNFYLCFVARPGVVHKSTSVDTGYDLLRAVRPPEAFGPSMMTWQSLFQALKEAQEDFWPVAGQPGIQISCLNFAASEMGSLFQKGEFQLITLLTDLWDGKDAPFTKRTKGGGTEVIEHPWINLIGCCTPSWVAENWSTYFSSGGFASRTLFVYGDRKERLIAYPSDFIRKDRNTYREKLIQDLREISLLSGEFSLTPSALKWGRDWYHQHDQITWNSDVLEGYAARKQAHIHKTALILEASKGGNKNFITPETLQSAATAVTQLEGNITKVFSLLYQETPNVTQTAGILGFIRENSPILRSLIYRRFLNHMSAETIDKHMVTLLRASLITEVGLPEGLTVRFTGEKVVGKVQAKGGP